MDFTTVNEIIQELTEIGERLSEKSDLLRAENEIKEQMASIAEQNRLYDTIASRIRPQLKQISQLIECETDFDRNMALVCVLNCYIKRTANLSLLADCSETLDSGELFLSINESVDYLRLCGVSAVVSFQNSCLLPADAVLLGFDLWQQCVEMTLPETAAIMATISDDNVNFIMKITVDGVNEFTFVDEYRKRAEVCKGSFNFVIEDETCFLTLTVSKVGAVE